MSIPFQNPWGKTSDNNVQRDDLFIFDLGPISAALKTVDVLQSFQNIALLPDQSEAWFYGTLITMPSRKVETVEYLNGSVPRNLPAYLVPPDGLKIEFLVDVQSTITQPKIINLLTAWRALIRVGRPSPYGGPAIELPSASYKPVYKYDLPVYGYEGVTSTSQSKTSDALPISQNWILKACWPTDHQVNQLSQETGLLKVSVNFACASLLYTGGVGHSSLATQVPTNLPLVD